MPLDYTEICIEGGNHALFGNYGKQDGDHEANISREDQQNQTVTAILQMIENHTNQKAEDTKMTYLKITLQKASVLSETPSPLFY